MNERHGFAYEGTPTVPPHMTLREYRRRRPRQRKRWRVKVRTRVAR